MVMTLCPLVSSPLLLIDHFKMMLTETNILEWGRGRREGREGGGGKGGREEEEGGGGWRRGKEEEGGGEEGAGEGRERRRKEGMGEEKTNKKKFRYRFGRKDFFAVKGTINNRVKVERGYTTTNNYDNNTQSAQILLCVLSSTYTGFEV